MSVLAVDFGGTAVKLGVLGDGVVVRHREIAADTPHVLDAVADAGRVLLGRERPDAVGIAMPGIIGGGRYLRSTPGKYPFAIGRDIAGWAQASFGAPATVENDARAALVGEMSGGCAAGEPDVALMTLGTGIGTAVAIGGTVLRGAEGHAGNLGGHVTVALTGPPCPCGNRGCAERVANLEVAKRYPTGYRGLLDALPDARAQELWDLSIAAWSAVAAALCQFAGSRVLVLGGGVLGARDRLVEPLAAALEARLWQSMPRPRVVVADDPLRTVLRGLEVLARGVLR